MNPDRDTDSPRRLRLIVLLLALLAAVATTVGGYLYHTGIQTNALNEADRKATAKITGIKSHLSSFLAEQLKPVRTLAGLAELRTTLMAPSDPTAMAAANSLLDHFADTLGADVCYLMDRYGRTIASSNRNDPDSFVGQNFSFRPYFTQALGGTSAIYMALGTSSGQRGVYYSFPVLDQNQRAPVGVAVIKASLAAIEDELTGAQSPDEHLLLIDPHGIIFIASNREWLFSSLKPLAPEEEALVAASRQFGTGPWPWLELDEEGDSRVVNHTGRRFLIYRQEVDEFPGWQIVYLHDEEANFTEMVAPRLHATTLLLLPMLLCIGILVIFLYQRASREIAQRKTAEDALRHSEKRYRTLYQQTPAMLHSIDPSGRMLSVSDYWQQALGYSQSEVIGRRVSDFMTPESRLRAENDIIPHFLKTGVIRDIPYQFVRKDGVVIDVLLSAIAERDPAGAITRSLAILVDVSEKRAQEQLRRLSASILAGQEKERAAIARELHDELGQILTALRMDAVWLHERLKDSDPKLAARSLTMRELIDKTIDEVRSMAVRLRPGLLDDLGLIAALEWMADDFEKRSQIPCTFRYHGEGRVDDQLATAIYRITQEALTNVMRHAAADHVEVILRQTENRLELLVNDDGRGFAPHALATAEGLGITGMRERAALINATMTLESTPGQGTSIRLSVPHPPPVKLTPPQKRISDD